MVRSPEVEAALGERASIAQWFELNVEQLRTLSDEWEAEADRLVEAGEMGSLQLEYVQRRLRWIADRIKALEP